MSPLLSIRRAVVKASVLVIVLPAVVRAQSTPRDVPHRGSIQVEIGLAWTSGYSPTALSATETANPSVRTSPLTLFQTSPKVGNAAGVVARLGMYLTPRWSVEGGVQFERPTFTVRTSSDFESAADAAIEEVVTQYLVEGSVVYQFARMRNGRGAPFVLGGAGYLREIDEDAAHVETGTELHAGAGFSYWFGRVVRRVGLRVEGRVSARTNSIEVGTDTKRRILPTLSGAFAYRF